MNSYTVKNYIKNLNAYGSNNKYEIKFKGTETGNSYKFKMSKDTPLEMVLYDNDDNEVMLIEITNIDTINFPDKKLKPIYLEEVSYTSSGTEFELNKKHIAYPAQLYITLFKRMQRRVNLVFEHNGKQYSAYYIEGKVILTEELNNKTTITITNLTKLNTLYHNYNILYVSPMLQRYSFKQYLDTQEEIARLKGNEVETIKYDKKDGVVK